MGGFDSTTSFNPNVIEFVSASLGSFLTSTGRSVTPLGPIINNTAGTVEYGSNSFGLNPAGPNGEGIIATLTFRAKGVGQSNLSLSNIQIFSRLAILQPNGQIIGGTVRVQ